MLTAQWTHTIPLLQQQSPAELAAELIQRVLSAIEDIDTERYTVIDFCSGAGGPTPYIEKAVNTRRAHAGYQPLPFRLSDIHPHIDAWMEAASHSANLSFIPQPVDATAPPASVVSKACSPTTNATASTPLLSSSENAGTKTFHLFSLSFHHFPDPTAQQILQSTLRTSDGFAILELQDRTIGAVLMLLFGEPLVLFFFTWLWFSHDWLHLACTYVLPVLPAVQAWDGVVSCLRTRRFEEIVAMVELVEGVKAVVEQGTLLEEDIGDGEATVVRVGDWRVAGIRRRHTWPFGYLHAVVGVPVQPR